MRGSIPSLFPVYEFQSVSLRDGSAIPISTFCKTAIDSKSECRKHYEALKHKQEGYYQCPFGFTSRSFGFDEQVRIITGVIAFPRFDSASERERAKRNPNHKVARQSIESNISYLRQIESYRADAVQDAAKVLPQAFHELRKLNGAVIQHAERDMSERGETRNLLSIKSAAELMRNNFDILEALSNIEGMRALPLDSTVNLFDLVYKMKRILQERATDRSIGIQVSGVRAIIHGSQKSFPIVPAVLLENAIKYGVKGHTIRADVAAKENLAVLTVENETDSFIDGDRCFERGARFTDEVEGGGFGLFLAREVVHTHKGTIRCEIKDKVVRMIVEVPLYTVAS